ncbi:MAG: hypothetical protein H5U24_14155 [Thioclava marina]|uniref:hypothetical protein n=1 Tax=Thioclava marina TaxID=1915077 RepID=UPI00199E4798|nr:hypothetical protein [Thioclava marina]MBC7146527.1 hypothetical protein [Thioclava marina]
MDRISGLMPQIGWSPLLMAATPKTAPASTVEPAMKSADTNGGMGADVDTQTPQDHAQQVRALGAMAEMRANAAARGSHDTADGQGLPPPDPDPLTGPLPTFEVTPLEAKAAALKAAPELIEPKTTEDEETTEQTGPSAAAKPETETLGTATKDAPPDDRGGALREGWSQVAALPTPNLDVTR